MDGGMDKDINVDYPLEKYKKLENVRIKNI